MLTDRRLPTLSLGARPVDATRQDRLTKLSGSARYLLRFDIAGGNPNNIALYRGNTPVGFVNRCGHMAGECPYMPGTIYLEQDDRGGYCFTREGDPLDAADYRIYECASLHDELKIPGVEHPLITSPPRHQPRGLSRRWLRARRHGGVNG